MDRGTDEVSYLSHGEMLAEITDKLPPREDRSQRAGRRRKKRAQKKRMPEEAAQLEPSEDGEKKKRSRKKKKRGKHSDEGRPQQGHAQAQGQARDGQARDGQGQSGPAQGQLPGVGSTTFTGKPPPEVMERLKAERRARMSRRDPMAASSDLPAASNEGARPAAEAVSDEPSPERRSIFDRLFGSR